MKYEDTMAIMVEFTERMARELELTAARMVYASEPHRIFIEGGEIKIAPVVDYWEAVPKN